MNGTGLVLSNVYAVRSFNVTPDKTKPSVSIFFLQFFVLAYIRNLRKFAIFRAFTSLILYYSKYLANFCLINYGYKGNK